jgi:hypothetical protein
MCLEAGSGSLAKSGVGCGAVEQQRATMSNTVGLNCVLELRSRYGRPVRLLNDPAKYYDLSFSEEARQRSGEGRGAGQAVMFMPAFVPGKLCNPHKPIVDRRRGVSQHAIMLAIAGNLD